MSKEVTRTRRKLSVQEQALAKCKPETEELDAEEVAGIEASLRSLARGEPTTSGKEMRKKLETMWAQSA